MADLENFDSAAFRTIQCKADTGFAEWLSSSGISLAITTYQGGKLMFIGWTGEQLSLHARNFERAMGLDVRGNTLVVASRTQIHWFTNASVLASDYFPDQPNHYDALYLHRASYYTGDIFAHDIALAENDIFVVNTRFSCLATPSRDVSFVPTWQPSFISDLAPEDRCHLNGLALYEGHPRTVTALGKTDSPRGWRENKADGGIVMDTECNEIILEGLSMPHSPRWHRKNLWVLDSGRGALLKVDVGCNRADVVCSLPGYLRGLTFHGDTAVVGLCKIREKKVFGGSPVESQYSQLLCGIALVDLNTGQQIGLFEFTDGVEEIYDIRVMPDGILRPNLLTWDLQFDVSRGEAFTAPEFSYLIQRDTDRSSNR